MNSPLISLLGMYEAESYFNSHPTGIRGFYEAASVVTDAELKRGKDERGFSIRNEVYVLGDRGYICWNLSPFDNGILNYNPRAILLPYPLDAASFVEEVRLSADTAGFLPMDVSSLSVLENNGHFDERYLRYWIGMDIVHSKESIKH